MKWLTTSKETYKKLHRHTQKILIICSLFIGLQLLAGIVLSLLAGTAIQYYTALFWVSDIMNAMRPCAVIMSIGVLSLEAVLRRTE